MGAPAEALSLETLDDLALARRVGAGDGAAAHLVIRRNNQRLFRAAWSVLKNRADAEDAVQDAYLKAFAAIGTYAGDAALSTWLTRIAINEAIGRQRAAARRERRLREQGLAILDQYRASAAENPSLSHAPEENAMRSELTGLVRRAVEHLPEAFRIVFVLREVEGLSGEEAARTLGVPEETVRSRLFRARRRLRQELGPALGESLAADTVFAGADCDRLTERVLTALTSLRG